jgi:hypothetical protein
LAQVVLVVEEIHQQDFHQMAAQVVTDQVQYFLLSHQLAVAAVVHKIRLLGSVVVLEVVVVLEQIHQNQVVQETHLPHHHHKEVMVVQDSQDQMFVAVVAVVVQVQLEQTEDQVLVVMAVMELRPLFRDHQ